MVLGFGSRSSILSSFMRGKFSRSQSKGRMTPKMAPIGYYKGVGCRSLGYLNRKARFILVKAKVPEYVIPSLKDFKLKPYVAWNTPKVRTVKATLPPMIGPYKQLLSR
ncbi:39S ribosomal protein L41-A, mitochondrial [Balamuthia mandrillaris]